MAVYFIRAGESGPVKIGSAADVDERLRQLQVGNHEELSAIRVVEGTLFEERWLHDHFRAQHIRHEWFCFSKDMLTVSVPSLRAEREGWQFVFKTGLSLGATTYAVAKWRSINRIPPKYGAAIVEKAQEAGVILPAGLVVAPDHPA